VTTSFATWSKGLLVTLALSCGRTGDDPPVEADADTGADEGDSDADDGWVWDDGSDPAGDVPDATRALVDAGEVDDAELVGTLSVARTEGGAERRVVLRLGPGELPPLQSGDRLIVPAEVQVTTRCDVGQSAPGCNYNPTVAAQLILTGANDDKDPGGAGSAALSSVQKLSCTKGEHHCLFTFTRDDTDRTLTGGLDLPCVAADVCHVNLVMWAWHPDARAGGIDKLLVGENEGDYLANGVVQGDKGRIMVVRERELVAADRPRRETSGGGDKSIPTDASPTLVYSHALKPGDLVAGEQFLVEAKLVAAVGDRARVSTQMFLAKDPGAKDPKGGLDKTAPVSIGEHNGINCTAGTSPCTLRKAAVFRVTDDITGPVYVQLIVKSAVPGGGSTSVTIRRDDGFVRSTRYRAAIKG
jgi:hypothetical protein